MKIGEWCEAQNTKATTLAKQLEDLGLKVTRQSLAGVIRGEKQAPLDVALAINEISSGLVTLKEMVLTAYPNEAINLVKDPVEEETEDLDDLLANL